MHAWLVAFAFGLLQGMEFAGALSDIGPPQLTVPLALLYFNLEIETGQLLFVGLVIAVGWWERRYFFGPTRRKRTVPLGISYFIAVCGCSGRYIGGPIFS